MRRSTGSFAKEAPEKYLNRVTLKARNRLTVSGKNPSTERNREEGEVVVLSKVWRLQKCSLNISLD
jgi:hypothetical protein